MKRLVALVALSMALVSATPTAQQAPAPQLVVTDAAPDISGETLTITGANFGNRPLVTLDLIPLTVQIAVNTQIVAAAPVSAMPAGDYLLSVSRGPSAADNGSFTLTLGAGGPKREDAAKRLDAAPAAAVTPGLSDPAGSTDRAPGFAAPGAEPAAKVGERVITVAEVDREWRRTDPASYLGLSREIYDTRRRVVDTMVADELLAREAAARGLTTDALLKEEIPRRIVTMPESAVTALYQGLGDSTRGATLEQMRPALRVWLERNTEPALAKMTYIEELIKVSTRVDTFLAAPRVQIERAAQDATIGPASASVEIVAFGDLQSPEYARLAQAFGNVRNTFGDRIRLVFKHLPALGPESVAAAEAAACANAQGKFWEYHDRLIAQPGEVGSARLAQAATAAGIGRDTFDPCVERGQFRDAIRQAMDEADRYGIERSPSFLINGRLAPPPPPFLPPFDFFKRLIEEELGQLAKSR